MGKKTSAAGVAAIVGIVGAAWVLNHSDGAHSRPGAAPEFAASRPGLGVDGAQALAQVRQASGTGAAPTRAVVANADSAASRPRPQIVPSVDWARYPGTLNTQMQQALQGRDGVMAADLARKLRECEIVARQMQPDMIQMQAVAGGDAALQEIRKERLRDYQRILANCQTVTEWPSAQRALLDVAVEQRVIGAAVQSLHLSQRKPEVLQGVVRDALAGDVSSLVTVTSHLPSTLGISKELQRTLRYAFDMAADDPEVGTLVRRYVSIAESAALALGSETQTRFSHEGLTDAQRAQARDMASQLVLRVKQPRDEVGKVG